MKADVRTVEPPWLADLPRLAGVLDYDGHPTFHRPASLQRLPNAAASLPGDTSTCPDRALALAFRRRCPVCGCHMAAGREVFNVFHASAGNRPVGEHAGGLFTISAPGPMHASCAVYSVLVCPFLKHPTSRGRHRDAVRGVAAVVAFGKFGVAFYDAAQPPWGRLWRFAHWQQSGAIPFQTHKDLMSMYDGLIAADAEVIDTATRLFWSDNPTDTAHLSECARADEARLQELRADASVQVGGYGYKLVPL